MFAKTISVADSLSIDAFSEFVDVVIVYLSDAKRVRSLSSRIEEYSSKHQTNLIDLSNDFKCIILIATDALRNHITSSQMSDNLKKAGLSDEKVDVFVLKWQENYDNIVQTILSERLTVSKLVDVEWKFGVTAASTDSNCVGKTFLQLKLVVKKGDEMENVFIELTLPQFYSFLHEMERAKISMEQMS